MWKQYLKQKKNLAILMNEEEHTIYRHLTKRWFAKEDHMRKEQDCGIKQFHMVLENSSYHWFVLEYNRSVSSVVQSLIFYVANNVATLLPLLICFVGDPIAKRSPLEALPQNKDDSVHSRKVKRQWPISAP